MAGLTLTAALAELRRPFATAAIKMKPQATTGDGEQMRGLVTYYIDARLAAARLTHVVADGWSDAYDVLIRHPDAVRVGIPVECRLTVLGVTRSDVGQIQPGDVDDKAWKSAYSDAFKRAAVKFEVGAYLYGGPQVWAPVRVGRNGKAQGFSDVGVTQARTAYAQWIGSARMVELYGEPLDHGDADAEPVVVAAAGTGQAVEEATAGAAAPAANGADEKPTKAELAKLVALVDGLIAGGHVTATQVASAARLETPWPQLADALTREQVNDLTGRLGRYAANLGATS